MAGMIIPMDRKEGVPRTIAAGCDMFLFAKNLEEDLQYMSEGVKNGIITKERLDDAVTKILATKAALNLNKKDLSPKPEKYNKVLGNPEFKAIEKECADRAITLVKNNQNILPISTEKHKKILYYPIDSTGISLIPAGSSTERLYEMLRERGYNVDKFTPPAGLEGMTARYDHFKEYDLMIYVAALATKSNQTTVRIEWQQPMCANAPLYINAVPTIFISLENPYHLIDVPRVKTYINTYGSSEAIFESLIDKLEGKSEFKGISPVDAFCGKWDTRL
jgi:beta-N-acetylhexosaminidase